MTSYLAINAYTPKQKLIQGPLAFNYKAELSEELVYILCNKERKILFQLIF